MPLDVNDVVVSNLLEDSVSNSNSSWLSAMLLVRMYGTRGGNIGSHLIPRGFYKKLETVLHSNKDFTTTNYLLELAGYLPKLSINKESERNSLTISITQRPKFLLDIPSSVTTGSFKILYYLSDLNKTFKNLYQLKSTSSKNGDLNKSFEKGEMIFLQVIDRVMILWCSSEKIIAPMYINLSNLKRFSIVNELEIRIELSKGNEFWNSHSLISSNSKLQSLAFNVELKRIQLMPSFLRILSSVITHNLNKISIASAIISAASDDQDSPKEVFAAVSSESQLSDIDISKVGSNSFPNCQRPTFPNPHSKKLNSNCKTILPNLELNSSIKEKLRNYKTTENHSLAIPPPNFFGEDPLSIEPLQSEDDSIKFKDFLENNKQRISRAPSMYSTEPANQITLPTPTRIIKDFHKVSKRYGKKTKKQSHKRDIWDFSSSVPSSPLRKPKMVTNSIRSTKSTEPEYLAHSIIPDSLASPTLLVPAKDGINNEKTPINSDAQKGPILELFATKSKSKKKNNIESSNVETIIPTTPTKSRRISNNLYNDIFDNSSKKNGNSVQVEDSLSSVIYTQGNSIRKFLDNITKQGECIKSSIDNSVNDRVTQGKLLKINTPIVGNSTTPLDNDKRNDEATASNDESRFEKSLTNMQTNSSNENSLLEDTTMKTSFLDYGSTLKELDINKQYSLISEGMNLLSSNLISRIKKFENDIFKKQKELHEELEENFKQIATNHCENLKNFNNYVKKKSDEIFNDFQ